MGRAEAPRRCRPRCAAAVPGPRETRSPRSAARVPAPSAPEWTSGPVPHGECGRSGVARKPRPHPAARCGRSPWQRNRHRPAIRRTGSGSEARRKRKDAGCALVPARRRAVAELCWCELSRDRALGRYQYQYQYQAEFRGDLCVPADAGMSQSQRYTRRRLRFAAPRRCCSPVLTGIPYFIYFC